jgi:hypothetical protein
LRLLICACAVSRVSPHPQRKAIMTEYDTYWLTIYGEGEGQYIPIESKRITPEQLQAIKDLGEIVVEGEFSGGGL